MTRLKNTVNEGIQKRRSMLMYNDDEDKVTNHPLQSPKGDFFNQETPVKIALLQL
jgi:hypothetical protein